MPALASTYGRVLALQGLCLLLVLLSAAGAIRWYMDATSLPLARQAYAQLAAAEALLKNDPAGVRAALDVARINVTRQAPRVSTESQPFLQQMRAEVAVLVGNDQRVVLSDGDDARLWLQSTHTSGHWIGLPVTGFRDRAARVITAIIASASVIAMVMAALMARVLVRPLEQLAEQADSLVSGRYHALALESAPREVRTMAAAIARAGEQTAQGQRERETLLAGISHDLRTPLARLRLALELDDHHAAEGREAMIADLAEMEHVIESCLSFVRDGRDEQRCKLDLSAVAREVLAQQSKPWSIIAPEPHWLMARPLGLRRALRNLLNNAEQHGQPPFALHVTSSCDATILQVMDSGPGVPADQLPRLIEPFFRADSARTSNGTGLGLSIAKRALELDGAALRFSNRSEGGLCVEIRFPGTSLDA